MRDVPLAVGEPAPWFVAPSPSNPQYHFDSVAGRYVVLSFFGSAGTPDCQRILNDAKANAKVFDGVDCCFFGVSVDRQDESTGRVQELSPGIRFFWDFDFAVSRLYGAMMPGKGANAGQVTFRRFSLVLDQRLRVLKTIPYGDSTAAHMAQVLEFLASQPPLGTREVAAVQAPVLVVPRIFEPEFCRTLIDYYETHGGEESGSMREIDGKTVGVIDHRHKRRCDRLLEDPELRKAAMIRLHDRLAPEIEKAFQFKATRIERYLVACYDSATGGYFKAHRDNTTKGTAHRRFAVSLHLNTGEYEGGDVRFPEFGRQTYKPPAGGAVVFSCSLLHEATPVTSGRRFVFLPFLYDAAAAKIREENLKYVATPESPPVVAT